MLTVSTLLAQHLKRWGITHVFGIPGKPVTPLILALDKQGITYVLSKHESGAGFEATGYAFAGKKLGVAITTAGPGGTNLLTAAGQALATNTPLLIITGQPPITEIGKVLGQDSTLFGTDLVKMFEPVTKFSARVDRGDLLEAYLTHALEKALTGVPGPVHLCIPLDVLGEQITPFDLPLPIHYPPVISSNLVQVLEMIEAAKRPVFFVGGRVHAADAYTELEELATRLGIPVITTPSGKGTFLSNHPLSLGPFGLGGNELSEAYLQQGVDLMIVIGSQLSDLELAGLSPAIYPEQIIHFEYDQTFIGKAISVPTLPVLGDLKHNLRALLTYAQEPTNENNSISNDRIAAVANVEAMAEVAAAADVSTIESIEVAKQGIYLTGREAMVVLREALPADAVVFGDAGSHSFYAIKYFDVKVPGTFHFEEVFATMGRAIGYSIGAQIARPDQTFVCLTGDGCLFMNGTEISTAVNYGAPVIFVVLNNKSLDMVEKGMARHLGKAVGTNYEVPLLAAKFGESMGAVAYHCTTAKELKEAITAAIQQKQVAVIEVMVDPDEIPPTMKRG